MDYKALLIKVLEYESDPLWLLSHEDFSREEKIELNTLMEWGYEEWLQ